MNWKFINIIATVVIVIANLSCGTSEDETPKTVEVYKEQHRPQFHFSPKEKQLNHLNQMVYYDNEYHLFYQQSNENNENQMRWSHAVSKDLVHWEDLPISLKSDSLAYFTAGNVITEWNLVSSYGQKGISPMIAFCEKNQLEDGQNYSSQEIIISNDKGRNWAKYDIDFDILGIENTDNFHHSKFLWHKESKKWVMIFAQNNKIQIYNSNDLKSWILTSEFGETENAGNISWESPDLFELTIEETNETKWIMLLSVKNNGKETAPNGGSGTQYFVGDFDGKTFENSNSKEKMLWMDYGRDNYNGVTWSNISAEALKDKRRFFVGLMNNLDYAQVVPTNIWQSAMTIPRELSLKNMDKGLRLISKPVKELEALRRKKVAVDRANYGFLQNSKLVMNQGTGTAEVFAEFEIPEGSEANFGIELKSAAQETYRVGFDAATNHYFSNRTNTGKIDFLDKFASRVHLAPRKTTGNRIKLHCYFDVSSAEIFTDDGMTAMTDIFFPTEDFIQINVFSDGKGGVELKGFTFYNLESIWK